MAVGMVEVEHDGIKIRIDHDDPAEERKAARDLVRELKSESAPPQQPSPPLSQVIEEYCSERLHDNSWTAKTEAENRAIFALFLEIVGDISIRIFGNDMAKGYKKIYEVAIEP
jgi:hypothetical protein